MSDEKMDFRPYMERVFFGMLFGGCALLWGEISFLRKNSDDYGKSISSISAKIEGIEKRLSNLEK